MSESHHWRKQTDAQKDLSEAARASDDLLRSWERAFRATVRSIDRSLTTLSAAAWEVGVELIVTVAQSTMNQPRRMVQRAPTEWLQELRRRNPKTEAASVQELYAIRRELERLGVIGSKRGKGLPPAPGEPRKKRGPDWLWVDEERIHQLVELGRESQTRPNQTKPEKTTKNQKQPEAAQSRAPSFSPKGKSEDCAANSVPQSSSFLLPSSATGTSARLASRRTLRKEEEEEEDFWQQAKEAAIAGGVFAHLADAVVRHFKHDGGSPADIVAIVAYGAERREAYREPGGALYRRLMAWRKGQSPGDEWLNPNPEWRNPAELARRREQRERELAEQLQRRRQYEADREAARESFRRARDEKP